MASTAADLQLNGTAPPAGATAGRAHAVAGVRVKSVDVAGLCVQGLRARLGEIARAQSRLAAMQADALGEIARRNGDGAAAQAAADAMSVSGRQARGEVRDAVRLAGLAATREGLAEGSIPAGHARLIAGASADAPIDEAFLAGRAPLEGYDEFRRTVARHAADASGDDGASLLEQQRRARTGQVTTRRRDGMTTVHLAVDPITGARLGTAIAAAERRLFKDEDPAARRTPAQRTADAITQLMLDPDTKRPGGASLIVVADYDMVNHRLTNGRLADGTPVPIGEIAKIAVGAELLPAVFDAATGDLRMGRSRRTASDLQRAALALRDKGCVGCGIPPERCQHHHIVEWQHEGHTDYQNLVTVCYHCHNHKIHQQGFTVERNSHIAGFHLEPPDEPPDPSAGPPDEQSPGPLADPSASPPPGPLAEQPADPSASPLSNPPSDPPSKQCNGRRCARAPPP